MDLIERQAAIDAFDMPLFNIMGRQNAERIVEYLQTVIQRIKDLPSAQPEPKWIPYSEPPGTDRNVFIARGNENFISCCIGHYDHEAETWYEDRNWFAQILYDVLYWCEMPTLPEPWRGEEHETN